MPIVLWFLAFLVMLPIAQAETTWPQTRELVAELQLDGEPLLDAIYLRETDEHLLLPMGELARLLGIGVTIDAQGRGAEGFILDERVKFHLALASQRVQWGGQEESFAPDAVRWIDDELHVELSLLQRWWPVELSFDPRSLVLHVRPRVKLPVQLRMVRERSARLGRSPIEKILREAYPLVEVPHLGWSVPSVDNLISLGVTRGEGGTESNAAYSATLAGDFFGMNAVAHASLRARDGRDHRSAEIFRDFRLVLSRHDPDGRLLGKLRATSVELGRIALPVPKTMPADLSAGWGALIGNGPLDRPSRYGVHTLRGWLPEGWDVTLFFNDQLAGFAMSSTSGVYEFADQPLFFGRNEFRLEFNGPQGQRRVEKKVYWLDQSVTEPGAAYYTLGLQHDDDARTHAAAHWELGLTKGLAMTAAATHTRDPRREVPLSRGQLGLRGAVFGSRLDLDQGWDAHGGRTTDVMLTTRLRGVSVNALRSWRIPSSSAGTLVRDEWRLSGSLPWSTARALPYTMTLRSDRGRETHSFELEPRFYWNVSGLNLQQAFRLRDAKGATALHGSTQLARHALGWAMTGQFAYRLDPAPRFESVSANLVANPDPAHRVNVGLSWTLDPRTVTLSLAWWKVFRTFGLGLNVKVADSGGVDASLQWSGSMARDPRRRGVLRDARPMATAGAVAAKVFLDHNDNGRFDAGEPTIESARFQINGGIRQDVLTDGQGEAVIARLRVNAPTDLALDPASLDDAQWQPSVPGVRIVPRAGQVQRIDFPVVATSEIEGVVMRRSAEEARPLGAIRMQLLNDQQQVEHEVRTAADGYFVIGDIKPGRYRLRADPVQLAGLGLAGANELDIEVGRQGGERRVVEFFVAPAVNRSEADTAAPPYLQPQVEMVVSRK